MEWISVDNRLPKKDGWYFVYAPTYSGGSSSGLKCVEGNMFSAFKKGKWSIEVGYHKRPGCVRYWMPLPEPPKDGIQSVSSLIAFYDKEEVYDNCTVQVLTNTKTGETSIGWRRNDE